MVSTGLAVLACLTSVVTDVEAAAAPGDIVLVSASASGEPGNGLSSFGLSASADGRYVAFASMATNLDPADTDNIVDVYVKDLLTGAVRLASVAADGVKGNAISTRPSISADGQRVAFGSAASNLSPDDTDGYFDIFVKDLQTGALTLASRAADGTKAAGGVEAAVISADGLAVGFSTNATNLSPDADDGESHVYVKSLDTDALTMADGGAIAVPDEQIGAYGPSLSGDGRIVSFVTDASGLDPLDADRRADVYVRDLASGEIRLASVNDAGVKGDLPSTGASLSADGTRVAFETASANLVAQDQDDSSDVYVKSLVDGSLQLASLSGDGTKANRAAGDPALSPDGRYVAFSSDATNLGLNTPPLVNQIYRKDLSTRELLPASVAPNGGPAGDYLSTEPSISRDGTVVAFVSPSTNLVPDGGNRLADVFAKIFAPLALPDTTPPAGHLEATPNALRPFCGKQPVLITGSGHDDGGIAHVSFSVVDEYDLILPSIDRIEAAGATTVTWSRMVSLDTWLRPKDKDRIYTIKATIVDTAANATTVSTQVVVSVPRQGCSRTDREPPQPVR
jgi:Tol biopolymer transport system component